MARRLLETLKTGGSVFKVYAEPYEEEPGWWRLTVEQRGEEMLTLVLPDGDASDAAETFVDDWLRYWREWS